MSPFEGPGETRSIFSYANFRVLSIARFVFTFGLQAQATIVGWWMYSLTHDPLDLGLIGLAEALPAIGFSLHAGRWVDRGKPYHIYRTTIVFGGLIALALSALAAFQGRVPAGKLKWMVFSCIFVTGVIRSFVAPSLFSLIPQMVPRQVYAASSAWVTALFQVASVLGPALAGFSYAAFGPLWSFLGVAGVLLVAFFVLHGVEPSYRHLRNVSTQEASSSAAPEGRSDGLLDGIRFISRNPIVLSAMTLDLLSVLFGGVVAILPAFADQVLKTGPVGVGFLRAAQAVGSFTVCAYLVLHPFNEIVGKRLLWAVLGFGLATLAFGFSRVYVASFICLAFAGGFDAISMIMRQTLLQLETPMEMKGRVAAVNAVFISSSNEIGGFESGLAAKLFGLVPSVIFGGSMTLVVVAGTALGFPQLRRARVQK